MLLEQYLNPAELSEQKVKSIRRKRPALFDSIGGMLADWHLYEYAKSGMSPKVFIKYEILTPILDYDGFRKVCGGDAFVNNNALRYFWLRSPYMLTFEEIKELNNNYMRGAEIIGLPDNFVEILSKDFYEQTLNARRLFKRNNIPERTEHDRYRHRKENMSPEAVAKKRAASRQRYYDNGCPNQYLTLTQEQKDNRNKTRQKRREVLRQDPEYVEAQRKYEQFRWIKKVRKKAWQNLVASQSGHSL
ncbi:hypothetical protein FACS18945_5820 [Bacteroidia bacterium]|nr:hypothetical protein FACS18945_5820 [Bacteroidia bacterium]